MEGSEDEKENPKTTRAESGVSPNKTGEKKKKYPSFLKEKLQPVVSGKRTKKMI